MRTGTRSEKTKMRRKEARKRVYKFFLILFILFIFLGGINVVNENIVYLEYLDNPNIFRIDKDNGTLDIFGKSYFMDFKILKKEN